LLIFQELITLINSLHLLILLYLFQTSFPGVSRNVEEILNSSLYRIRDLRVP